MIDKNVILDTLLERLEKLPEGEYLDVRTYKRNRSVVFVRTGDDSFLVIEDGFCKERFEDVPLKKIRKLFKTLLKKEFPRSTKIRLYTMGRFSEEEHAALNRKKI